MVHQNTIKNFKFILCLKQIFIGIFFLLLSSFFSQAYASPTLNGPVLIEDTFVRANSTSGWGTASNGNTWALLTSATSPGGTIGITNNQGTIKSNIASLFNILNPSVSSADQEGLVRWSINSTNSTAGILLRALNNSNYYLARYDGAGHIQFFKKVAGASTTTTAITFTPTLGSFYWLRFQIIGSTISIKEWADGSSEPASYQYTTTDTSFSAANGVGLYGFAGNSTNNTFDSFDVTNPSGATPTPTPTSTPTPTPTNTPTYTLNGTVFIDTNGNGIQDGLETGYQGATVAISGQGTGTATTDASGNYSFSSLGAGTYTVTLTVPGGYQTTTTNPATDPISSNTTTNFGIQVAPTPTPTPTPTPAPGLVVSSQTQSGISGGFTNNQPETDVTWTGNGGNGWRVGIIPAYGGAVISPWYEISSNSASITQTNLATSIPDGFFHWVIDRNSTFLGTESSPFTLTEQTPTGQAFRRYYSTQIPTSGSDSNGFSWNMKTAIYPGDPGFFVHRVDVTNPSASAISLGASDAFESDLIGGLQQSGETVWSPSNGSYGTIGGSATSGWPSGLTSINPDYIYITPITNSGINTGVISVRKTSLASVGGSSVQCQYQQNTSRLKFVCNATISSFPASTTKTLYYMQVLRRNLTQSDATSIAADYLNPDTPTMTTGTFTSFSYDEGLYQMAANGNTVTFTHNISGNVTQRWITIYKISNYTSSVAPAVKIGNTTLTANSDYLAYVDTINQIAYVKLMHSLVTSGASGSQLNNDTIQIYDATAPTSTPTPTPTSTPTPTPTPIPTYSISGTVYVDTNSNGIQDGGEVGFAGATVTVSGQAPVTTDSSGNYSVSGLTSTTYSVTLTLPGGYTATTSNPVTIPLSSNTTTNFGIVPIPTATPTPMPLPTSTPTPIPTNTPTPTPGAGPNISNITAIPTSSQATITWTTNIAANHTVLYSVTTSYGSSSGASDASVTNHSVVISFLLPCTTYHFEVQSSGTGTNTTTSSDNKFTTTGCASDAEVVATAEATLTSSVGGSTTLDDGSKEKATVDAPSSSLASDTAFQIHKVTTSNATATISPPNAYTFIGTNSFEIQGLTTTGTKATFHAPITVTLTYNSADLGSTDPTQLVIAHYDSAGWNVLSNCSVDTIAQKVSCQTSSFSLFSIVIVQPSSNSSSSTSSNSSTSAICTTQSPLSAPILYEIDTKLGSASLYFAPATRPYTSYTISYGPENHDDYYAFSFPLSNTTGAINVQVNALSPMRMYTFKVRANNDCAGGAWSNNIAIHAAWTPFFLQKNFISTPTNYSKVIQSNTKPSTQKNSKSPTKNSTTKVIKKVATPSPWWTFILHLF